MSGVSLSARAQDAPATEDVAEVVVTGSRIQNMGFNAPTPVTVVASEQVERRAPATMLEMLNELPAFRQSTGVNQAQRGTVGSGIAQNVVDLRGLGTARALVLVNGRRFVGTNNNGTLDTAVIPAGLVERVEVVTGGASAAYGSDAVAGVTNFILKNNLTGLQGSIQGGRSWRGDNNEIVAGLAGGMPFAGGRGHVVLGGEFQKNNGVGPIYQRKWSGVEPGNTAAVINFGANRPAGMPAQGWATGVEYATQTRGGVINTARTASGAVSNALNQIAFGDDGTPYTLVRGPVYGNLMVNSTSNYGASPLGNWPLKQPNKRATFMGLVSYDLTDNVEVFFEANVARLWLDNESSYHQTPTNTILRDNPFLPAAIRNQMVALNLTSFDMGRMDTDWPGLSFSNDYKVRRFTGGFKGKLFRDWTWDVYYQKGKTDGRTNLYGSRESNILAATYVVTGPNGQPMCGPLATNPNFAAARLTAIIDPKLVTAGCVPFNPFGVGRNSQAAIDYVSGWHSTDLDIAQDVAALNLSGSVWTLPAGDVTVAVGVEWRREKVVQTADASEELGVWSNGNNKSWSGKQTVKEGYVELGVPLLRDMPFLHSLDFNAAARRTDYATSGAVTTWKVGGTWEPVDVLRLRVTQSRDIRAPNLPELFSRDGVGAAATVFNPFNGQSARLATANNGNPDLTPEIADTFTAGVVWQPKDGLFSGLRASIDYYDIKVSDVIATVGGVEAITRCFNGLQAYCSAIEFDNSPFGIRQVISSPFNQSLLRTSGVDLELSYRPPMESFGLPGVLDFRVLATRVSRMERTDRAGTSLVTVDYAGTSLGGGTPRWNSTISANYSLGAFSTGLQLRLFSSFRYDPRLLEPGDKGYDPTLPNSVNYNRFPSIPYLNWNGSYNLTLDGHRVQLFAVVNNVLDAETTPLALGAINNGGNPYDYIGRAFKLGARFQW
jgi:outer membrane receptor protein involved in Fe transport